VPEDDRKDGSLFTPSKWKKLAARYRLTARQLDVARCITDDQSEAAIADELQVSRHTVHVYIRSLKAKLRVHSRAEVIHGTVPNQPSTQRLPGPGGFLRRLTCISAGFMVNLRRALRPSIPSVHLYSCSPPPLPGVVAAE